VPEDLYCSRGDVNELVSAGEIEGSSRIAASATAATDTITLNGHGLETDSQVMVRAAEGGTLPSPLTEDTVYYAIRISNAKFKLAATEGGAAINLTTDGSGELVVIREPPYDVVIEEWSRWADSFLPHQAPLEPPIHPLVRRLVAKLSAYELFRLDGKRSESFESVKLDAVKSFERLGNGVPLRGAAATASSNLAVTSSSSATSDPRGWGSGTLP